VLWTYRSTVSTRCTSPRLRDIRAGQQDGCELMISPNTLLHPNETSTRHSSVWRSLHSRGDNQARSPNPKPLFGAGHPGEQCRPAIDGPADQRQVGTNSATSPSHALPDRRPRPDGHKPQSEPLSCSHACRVILICLPQALSFTHRIDAVRAPPFLFVTDIVKRSVVRVAQRDRPLIADLGS
jgi:hypothetical protein